MSNVQGGGDHIFFKPRSYIMYATSSSDTELFIMMKF